jgi:hypothetical protein
MTDINGFTEKHTYIHERAEVNGWICDGRRRKEGSSALANQLSAPVRVVHFPASVPYRRGREEHGVKIQSACPASPLEAPNKMGFSSLTHTKADNGPPHPTSPSSSHKTGSARRAAGKKKRLTAASSGAHLIGRRSERHEVTGRSGGGHSGGQIAIYIFSS